jgi:hypothetical protein
MSFFERLATQFDIANVYLFGNHEEALSASPG